MLLILAGISLSSLKKDNGIIKEANEKTGEVTKTQYETQLILIGSELRTKKKIENWNIAEYMSQYEEKIKNDEAFKEATVTKNDKTIEVITKEGYRYLVTEDEVAYQEQN